MPLLRWYGDSQIVCARLIEIFGQIRTILDFKCLASLRTNNRMMTEMTQMSRDEGQAMLKLSEKTSRDTDVMKILTLLALIYLPASFVAVSTPKNQNCGATAFP